jgi:hypothetical protein
MKRVFFLFGILAVLIFATSCKKENVKISNTPKTSVPDDYVGKWQSGDFDMATFWSFNANTPVNGDYMVGYDIKKDGSAEQYIYYAYDDGSGKKTLTYRKGTVTFDAATKTLQFCPAEGTYRIFQDGKKTESAIVRDGLYPVYAPKYSHCFFAEDNQITYLVGTNTQNEQIGFASVAW